ncbi:MAG: glycoside hydrolase family 3 protein, partial [Anaerolineae bacterium]|nr:glycoside hydrolase family 3 protein [Anaerolineae bacterium]
MTTKIETLLSELTLEEKVTLLAGADTWRTHAIERLGIPALKVSDGPNGVRGENKDTKSQTSASFPIGTAMGATWNPELVAEIGVALGEETKMKGAHVLLGPTLNVHRHPLAGRNFECFSEDPHLSARMAVSYVKGLQGKGVGACIKHFVANNQEFERFSISTEVDERTMREIYLPAFKAAVQEAQPWTLMSAYNRVNGTYVSENKYLLNDILKGEWGFDGMVISDWYGTYSENVPAAGLDLEMPGPARWMGENVLEAVRDGTLDEAVVDDKVRRILRMLERVGVLDNPEIVDEKSFDNQVHRALIRKAGSEAIVLLKNEDDLLPIADEKIRSVAIIGRPAKKITFQGGGSSEVNPHYVVNPLEAIQSRYDEAFKIAYVPGPSIHRMFPLLEQDGLSAEDGTAGKISIQQYDNTSLSGEPFKEFFSDGTQ